MKWRHEPPDIPGVSRSVSSPEHQAFIAELRARGVQVTPATRDYLPPPRHILPPKQSMMRMYAGLRRLPRPALRIKHRHATVP